MNNKVLFILKKRQIYSEDYYSSVNSGLYNSATFVNNMLNKNIENSHLIEVNDNNEIDKYVTEYKPDIVIIEALWVVPSKFEVLHKLHPNVRWIIRLHSELPFIANEGVAIKWLKQYGSYENVEISANSLAFIESMEPILGNKIVYLPNYYPISEPLPKAPKENWDEINIGLFGAIRPMKNCLTQAIAAMIYADKIGAVLNLHINTERIEQKGENTFKNIKALFEGSKHNLVEHKWYKHSDFVELVSTMDLGLQVSLTETYNIVAADFVNQNVPVVTSKEIPFINFLNTVKGNKNAKNIAKKIGWALELMGLGTFLNKTMLACNSEESEKIWLKFLKG